MLLRFLLRNRYPFSFMQSLPSWEKHKICCPYGVTLRGKVKMRFSSYPFYPKKWITQKTHFFCRFSEFFFAQNFYVGKNFQLFFFVDCIMQGMASFVFFSQNLKRKSHIWTFQKCPDPRNSKSLSLKKAKLAMIYEYYNYLFTGSINK